MAMLNISDPANAAESAKDLLKEVNHRMEVERRSIENCQKSISFSEVRLKDLAKAKEAYESILSLMGA